MEIWCKSRFIIEVAFFVVAGDAARENAAPENAARENTAPENAAPENTARENAAPENAARAIIVPCAD